MIAIINNEISKDVFSRLHFSGFGIDKNSFQSIRRQLICPSGTQQRWEDFTCGLYLNKFCCLLKTCLLLVVSSLLFKYLNRYAK